jgi:hypothetical protein
MPGKAKSGGKQEEQVASKLSGNFVFANGEKYSTLSGSVNI